MTSDRNLRLTGLVGGAETELAGANVAGVTFVLNPGAAVITSRAEGCGLWDCDLGTFSALGLAGPGWVPGVTPFLAFGLPSPCEGEGSANDGELLPKSSELRPSAGLCSDADAGLATFSLEVIGLDGEVGTGGLAVALRLSFAPPKTALGQVLGTDCCRD